LRDLYYLKTEVRSQFSQPEAKAHGGWVGLGQAVVKVLAEFNRRRRMAELVKYSGTFSERFPTNDEIEAIDAAPDRDLNARPRR
jgi:hypothetical protein